MEWVKLGASVGFGLWRMASDNKDTQLNETIRQRDVYKKEVDCLKSHLRDVKRQTVAPVIVINKHVNSGTANRYNAHTNTRNFNQVSSQSATSHTKLSGQSHYEGRKSYQEHRDPRQNTSKTTHQKSQPWGNSGKTWVNSGANTGNSGINTGKTWGNSGINTGKTNSSGTWGSSGRSNGKVNFRAPSGRGNSHSRGQGRGKGNSHQ